VEADLAAALESGQVGSAGVDDPNINSPLINAKNIIFTPYVASQNVDTTLAARRSGPWRGRISGAT
jgi:phosphoglycerate dehydrogenase-like enzyme